MTPLPRRDTASVSGSVQSDGMKPVMVPPAYSRIYPRFLLRYPVIFGGARFVGEGILANLSFSGCSVLCDREVLCGSQVQVRVFLPDQAQALAIELGTIKWVEGNQFGVEFLRLPQKDRQRLNSTLRIELIHLLKTCSGRNELLELLDQRS